MNSCYLASCFAVLIVGASTASEPITLNPEIATGKKYTVRHEATSKMQVPLLGGEGETVASFDLTMAVRKDKDSRNRLLSMSLDNFKMKMDMGGQVMEFDSADPAKQHGLLKAALGGIAGRKFDAVIDDEGNIIEIRDDGKAGAGIMGMGFGRKEIKQMIGSMFDHGLPTKPVKPGDTWKHSLDTSMGRIASLKMSLDYRYAGPGQLDGKAYPKLLVTGKRAEEEADDGKPAALADFKKSESKGVILYDNKLGIARYTEMQMDVVLATGGEELPMSSKAVSRLVKVEDLE